MSSSVPRPLMMVICASSTNMRRIFATRKYDVKNLDYSFEMACHSLENLNTAREFSKSQKFTGQSNYLSSYLANERGDLVVERAPN